MEKTVNNFNYEVMEQNANFNTSEVVLSDGQGSLPLGAHTYHPAWAKSESGMIQPILTCTDRKSSFWPCGILKSWNEYSGTFCDEFKKNATTMSTEEFVEWWKRCSDFTLVVSDKTLIGSMNPYTGKPGRKARIDY